MCTENGQTVLQNVGDQEPKREQGLVPILLQLLGARIVMEAIQTLSHVTMLLVQVSFKPCQVSFKPWPCSGEF